DPGIGGAVCLAYAAPARDSESFPAFLLLAARLASRSQSQIGLNRIRTEYSVLFDDSTLFVMALRDSKETADTALARLEEFVATALKPKLSAGDIAAAKNQFALELGTTAMADKLLL